MLCYCYGSVSDHFGSSAFNKFGFNLKCPDTCDIGPYGSGAKVSSCQPGTIFPLAEQLRCGGTYLPLRENMGLVIRLYLHRPRIKWGWELRNNNAEI